MMTRKPNRFSETVRSAICFALLLSLAFGALHTNRVAAQEDADGLPEFETGVEYKKVSPRTKVTFNLEEASLPDLVRLISNLTGRRFIISDKARNIKATIFSPTKVSVAEAYNAFLAILNINGLTVVPAGRYLKIVETQGAEKRPIPIYGDSRAVPASERFVTRLHRLEHVSADDVTQLLERFKSNEGSLVAYAPTNTLIITDTGTQIRRMLRILESIDVTRTGEQIWIEPMHHASATDIAERLGEIFPSSVAGGGAGAKKKKSATKGKNNAVGTGGDARITNIMADERTNSLIILATERAYIRILEMVRALDVPLDGDGRVHVHYVQNGKADDIASALGALVGSGGAAPRRSGRGASSGSKPAAAASLFEGEIKVAAHEASNALIITASNQDYAALRRVIDKLDAPRRQVFIEAVVMSLDVQRSSELGLSYHGGIPNTLKDGAVSVVGFQAQNSIAFPASPDALTALALGIRGPTLENSAELIGVSVPAFGVALKAMAGSSDANIMSTPHIIAMDNEEAEITVGQNVPLQTNSAGFGNLAGLAGAAGAGGATGAGGNLAALAGLSGGGFGGALPRQDVGTTIRITPHINDNNRIQLDIEEEISEVGARDTQGGLGAASINRRTAKTKIALDDQETVVIGGLMRDEITTAQTKIPILGDIPLLGALFRTESKTKRKTNLLLILTPYIIRDQRDMRAIYERKMQERQDFIDRYMVFADNDYEPPVDYSRTRGVLGEVFREIKKTEEAEELAALAKATPKPEHEPRPPVGAAIDGGNSGPTVISPDAASTAPSSAIEYDRLQGLKTK